MSEATPPDELSTLRELCRRAGGLKLQELDLDERLKTVKKQLAVYEEKLIPELLRKLGMLKLTLESGLLVERKTKVRGTFPEDPERHAPAIEWLKQRGESGVLRREFVVSYGVDGDAFAEEFGKWLEERGVSAHADVSHKTTIHPSTLGKLVRDSLRDGTDIPTEAFGVQVLDVAEFKAGG